MVQISEHSIGPDDVVVTIYPHSELWKYPASGYQRVQERTWAKLDENSPVPGLCTDLADTCLVFVCHCNSTRRTSMMHTPSMVDIQVVIDQLEYITNGTPLPVEVVIVKGAVFPERKRRDLPDAVRRCVEDDIAWLDQFVRDMQARAKKQSLPLTVTRPTRCLEHGCMLVDKCTGRITIPVPAKGFESSRSLYVGMPEPMSESRFLQIRAQDQFYRIISTSHAVALQQYGFTFAYPSYLQYDGKAEVPSPRMPDFARTIFQYFVLYGLIQPGVAIPINDKLNVTISEELREYVNAYPLREQGMFCEVCRQPAKSACNSCRSAWYCRREHQTSDWKAHRAWCRAHRVVNSGASTPNRRDSGIYSQSSAQISEAIASRLEGREETAEIGDPKVAVNAVEDTARFANEEPARSPSPPSQIQAITETETIEQQTTSEAARQDDVAPAVQEEPSDSTPVEAAEPDELLSQQKTLAPRNSQSVLYKRLSVTPLRDASAMVHRKLKMLAMLFCSWKFYFCIFSVVLAYLVQLGRSSYLFHTLAITPASI